MTTLFAFSFMGLGLQEILVIAIIGMLLFGATRLPDLGRSLGKTVTGFRDGMRDGGSDAMPNANQPQTTKVEPEPLKPPQRLSAPTFGNSETASQPPKS